MNTIILRGREIPLLYTTYEMKQIQEEIAPLGEVNYVIFGRNKDDEEDTSLYGSPGHLEAVGKLIRILGNAGLEESGETADLTDKWVMRALKPSQIVEAVGKCIEAMNDGMASEVMDLEKKEDNEPVDVTLEQMKKKKETDG